MSSRTAVAVLRGILVFGTVLLGGLASGDTRATVSQATLRAAPRADAAAVATIPAGAVVTVSTCSDTWCAASWSHAKGWIARRYLGAAAKSAHHGRGYINSDGEWVPSPRVSPSGQPAGASAECNDGTYSFSKHRRGTCSHHGGVRRWL
jgi:uncharacterized protein YraI